MCPLSTRTEQTGGHPDKFSDIHSFSVFIYLFIFLVISLLVLSSSSQIPFTSYLFSQLNFVFQIHTTPFSNKHVITPLLVRRIWY